eukprot:CAMPEP_0178938542 /NCGR_PEP_ID=MMETSP0786-20121207/26387_1 /TAXON_ID=186022 /ORGANISM="Thalassionema frauenfeldii, Strain CCMP 1798" /LENGTH=536 /DNA_ID=CAMNT_0020617269 /DNA_START=13 /DNA_END=1623 /DNA_ORIENTATION=-
MKSPTEKGNPYTREENVEVSKTMLANMKKEFQRKADEISALSSTVIEEWKLLPAEVRRSLAGLELGPTSDGLTSIESLTSSSCSESGISSKEGILVENYPQDKEKVTLIPLERAPKNVFAFSKCSNRSKEVDDIRILSNATSNKETIVTTTKGWRNIFSLPISYDVNMIPHGTIFDPNNPQLLESTGVHPEDYKRRFAVIDQAVEKVYGDQIRSYFQFHSIELHYIILAGGEPAKRPMAIDAILDKMCEYKLRRREPFLAIGGGCVLDICGVAACLYRRGVPFVRVPTTLLAIVDASVGVKNGVDYCCNVTDETYKNRVGSFYAPSACLLDTYFVKTQDKRNISNGFAEILKLALVRSSDLFDLVEAHGASLVASHFEHSSSVPHGVSKRIIELSIQIMLEELGPNLWEHKLERCVDYGHTFSKLLEMVPNADIMHGEAVNIDGFFCCILSYLRGHITMDIVERVFKCMQSLSLPTNSPDLDSKLAWQSCCDAIEHRNGAMRIPLITGIGESIVVSDITQDELDKALLLMEEFSHA